MPGIVKEFVSECKESSGSEIKFLEDNNDETYLETFGKDLKVGKFYKVTIELMDE